MTDDMKTESPAAHHRCSAMAAGRRQEEFIRRRRSGRTITDGGAERGMPVNPPCKVQP